jgi:hypothetical protein
MFTVFGVEFEATIPVLKLKTLKVSDYVRIVVSFCWTKKMK